MEAFLRFLINAQEELIDLIEEKYEKSINGLNVLEEKFLKTFLSSFVHILNRFSGDPDIKAIIIRTHLECGKILGTISENYSNTSIFYDMLDEKSRVILHTPGRKGYATIEELSTAAQSTHYVILQRLREVINHLSIRRFGKPFAVFMESKTLPVIGEKILFSWWLNDKLLYGPRAVEVTIGKEKIFLLTELAGQDLPRRMQAAATFNHGILEVTVEKGGISYGR